MNNLGERGKPFQNLKTKPPYREEQKRCQHENIISNALEAIRDKSQIARDDIFIPVSSI